MTKESDDHFVMKVSAHCKATLHRAMWQSADGPITVYVHADDCEAARKLLLSILGCLAPDQGGTVELGKVYSYAELLSMGVSACEDLRIFEVESTGEAAIEWIDRPLFLSTDQTLIAQWVMLLMHRVQLVAFAIGSG